MSGQLTSLRELTCYSARGVKGLSIALLSVMWLLPGAGSAFPVDTNAVEDLVWDLYESGREYPDSSIFLAHQILQHQGDSLPVDLRYYLYEIIGDSYYMKAEYDSALRYLFIARGMMEDQSDSISLAYNGNYLAAVYNELGLHDKAARYYFEAKEMFTKEEDIFGLSLVNYGLSLMYSDRFQYERSLEVAWESHRQTLEYGDSMGLGSTFSQLSTLYLELGQQDSAMALADLAIRLNKEYQVGNFELSYAFGAKADVLTQMRRYEESDAYIDSALIISGDVGDRYGDIFFRNTLARNYFGRNMKDSAWSLLDETRRYANMYGVVSGKRQTFRTYVILARDDQDWLKALNYTDSLSSLEGDIIADNFQILTMEENLRKEQAKARELLHQQMVSDLTLERNSALLALAIALALVALIALFVQRRSYHRTRKLNETLAARNQLISQKNEELFEQRATLEKNQLLLRKSNSDKDKLLTLISHDLRSPLAQVKSVSELILEGHINKEEEKMFFSRIHDSVDKSLANLTDVLVWARNQMEEGFNSMKRNIDARDAFEKAYALVENQFDTKNVRWQLICSDPPPKLLCDPSHLGTILRNLMSNAAKFSHRESEVVSEVAEDGDWIVLSVTDRGVGVSEDVLEEIFQQGLTLTHKGTENESGTGTGLQLVREFVEINGGKLKYSSYLGKGTTVSVAFPKAVD